MGLTWLDGIVLAILLAIVAHELRQEFGRGLLDTVAALGALHLAVFLAPWFAAHLALLVEPQANRGAWLGLLFVLLLVGGYFASRFLQANIRWTMDSLDPLFGLAFGFAVGIVCVHGATRALAEVFTSPGGEAPAFLVNSALASELVDFRSVREALSVLEQYQRGG